MADLGQSGDWVTVPDEERCAAASSFGQRCALPKEHESAHYYADAYKPINGQLLPAFIAALLVEGVEAEQVERAVARVADLRPGKSISGHPLRRAFAWEQARLLEDSL